MGKNNIKNIGLATFVGLFAFYGFTAHNIRIGSVSSAGIVIKYSKRGLASISCPPTQNAFDETSVDRLRDDQCLHHVASKELENGDVEYTVTTYYNGFTATGTKVYPAQEVAAHADHNTEFIKDLVRSSKAKFDEAEELAAANAEEPAEEEVEVATDAETTEEPAEDTATTDNNGRPEITVASSSNDEDSDSDSDLDEDTLMEAIEQYAELKISYDSCQNSVNDDSKIKRMISKYDSGLRKYIRRVEKFEASDDDDAKTPLEGIRAKDLQKLEEFVAEVDEFDSNYFEDEDDDVDTNASRDLPTCLLKRNEDIGDRQAQYENYKTVIQPQIRQQMLNATPETFGALTQSLSDASNPIVQLAQSNPDIKSSLLADYYGAEARVKHMENQKLQSDAQQLAEPMRTNRLRELKLESDKINSDLELKISNVAASNSNFQDIQTNAEFWAQQMAPLGILDQDETVNASADVGATTLAPSDLDEETARRLKEAFKRTEDAIKGSGNSRRRENVRTGIGQYNADGKVYRGESVPQLHESVDGSVQ